MIKEVQTSFLLLFFCSKAQPASHSGAKSFHCESAHVSPGGGRARGATFTHTSLQWNSNTPLTAAAPSSSRRAKCISLQLARLNKCHVARVVPPSERHASSGPRALLSLCGKLQLWQQRGTRRKSPRPALVLKQWDMLFWLVSNTLTYAK